MKITKISVKMGSKIIPKQRGLWLTVADSPSFCKTRKNKNNKDILIYLSLGNDNGRVYFKNGVFPIVFDNEHRSVSFVWKGDWEDEKTGVETNKTIPFTVMFERPIDFEQAYKLLHR
jgi:hypothetical protein